MHVGVQAETEALHQAVHLVDQMGIGYVIFATNCMTLKHAMASDEMDLSPLGIEFRQIKFLLYINFIEIHIGHCHRVCDKPAHVLASLGAGAVYVNHATWAMEVPDFCSPFGNRRFSRVIME
jgi:hypothetical protein